MMTRIAVALAFGALALSPALSQAEEDSHPLEQLAVETAQTPAQHIALAQHYREEAREARDSMHRHERMARSYAGGKSARKVPMERHCKSLAEKYAEMSEEYDALAKLHQEEATKTE
jgi:hypothetical protein